MKLLFKQFLNEHCVLGLFNEYLRNKGVDKDQFLDECAPGMWLIGAFLWPGREYKLWHNLHLEWMEWNNY